MPIGLQGHTVRTATDVAWELIRLQISRKLLYTYLTRMDRLAITYVRTQFVDRLP